MKFPARGLYAITQSEGKSPSKILAEVEAALKGGAAVVQYRDKHRQDATAYRLATDLTALCHAFQVPLVINDSVDLALATGADGVHLGKEDGELHEARRRLPPGAIIGVSCYNDLQKAEQAARAGADYVAFGRFFPSGSKPLATKAEVETLRLAKQRLSLPIVAIGGILPDNAGQLLQAGADVLAVIGGLFDYAPEQAARDYCALFT